MENLRREPFRLFFLLGALLAWVAVLPWVLFGAGWIRQWLGMYHALTMTQGFLLAIVVGFLGTMIPRRTGTEPLSTLELVIMSFFLLMIPVWTFTNRIALAELSYLVVLATLAQFVIRRIGRRVSSRPAPASFVFIPIALVTGVLGASLLIASTFDAPAWTIGLGRSLIQEGMLLNLVLAVAPMLTPIIYQGQPKENPIATRFKLGALHTIAGLVLVSSFAIQYGISESFGLLLRGGVVAIELCFFAQVFQLLTVRGLHRQLYRLALFFVPLGLLCAGIQPNLRIPLLHLTFIGGFSLLVFSVSFHVTFLHTGREKLALSWPWPVTVVGCLAVIAMVARASAEHFSNHYFEALALASSLWLLGALIWAIYLATLIWHPAKETVSA